MATITGSATTDDIEQHNEPLLNNSTEQFHDYDDDLPIGQHNRAGKPAVRVLATTAASVIFLVCLVAMILTGGHQQEHPQPSEDYNAAAAAYISRGKAQGVSEKTSEIIGSVGKQSGYESNDDMLMWQRTAYHFQPQKNWMNDPNGPLYHKGWYHLFYQYNPDSAIWGNITWGHAVSTDMVNWYNLPLAMIPDQWYDWYGVWTGSATLLPNGDIIMLYTGDTNEYVQVQNLAYPTNLSDPLLLNWTKYSGNPVMTPPTGIAPKDFRDPTTAWIGLDGLWRVLIGSKINKTGFALVYKTENFTTFELEGNHHVLHSVTGVGMWECVDFYPVNITGTDIGLDTSVNGDGVKHVLKASMDDDKHDWYAIGVYNEINDTWTPDDSTMDVGIGLRVDYGKYYASKTFYDQNKERRILWGWVGETDSEADDIDKGWASVQSVPRVVSYDNKTGSNIIQWPIQELEKLRVNVTEFDDIIIEAGSVVDLNISSASQLDIVAEFVVDTSSTAFNSTSDINNCTATGVRGAVGPFGILVLTDDQLTELTPVYFYIGVTSDGTINNWFCTDKSRSTLAEDVDKQVYGGPVPVLDGENYTMRILVDHSVVEAYGQGGRTCITSRIYPTQAINSAARLYVFNNATDLNVTASIKVHRMESATIIPYPFDQI